MEHPCQGEKCKLWDAVYGNIGVCPAIPIRADALRGTEPWQRADIVTDDNGVCVGFKAVKNANGD